MTDSELAASRLAANKQLCAFLARLLDPEDLGHAVTAEVRREARRQLHGGGETTPPNVPAKQTESEWGSPTAELRIHLRPSKVPGSPDVPHLQQKWVQHHIPAGKKEAIFEWRDVPQVKEAA